MSVVSAREIATPDPIPEKIVDSDIAIQLNDYVLIPDSLEGVPPSRLSYLGFANDGSDRMFVCDMEGKVHIIRNGQILPQPFLDVRQSLHEDFYSAGWETGLASFAFHPDYAKHGSPGYGKFYTITSSPGGGEFTASRGKVFTIPGATVEHYNVVSEWTVSQDNPDKIDPASHRELMRFGQSYLMHNVGLVAFNPGSKPGEPDYGMLYISTGDGGFGEDAPLMTEPFRQAQDPLSPYGKLLRINPLQQGDKPYTIPGDNPFVSDTGYLPEIWALGLRNPQRFSWDIRPGGNMYIGDIGESNIEEINIGIAGGNYGWSLYEGIFAINPEKKYELYKPETQHDDRFIEPVAMFDHDEGNAMTGGHVYRGRDIPGLYGKYVFGDIPSGKLFIIDADQAPGDSQARVSRLKIYRNGKIADMREIVGIGRADIRIGIDKQGELYTLTKMDGFVRRIRPVDTIVRENETWYLFQDDYGTGIEFTKDTFQDQGLISVIIDKASDPNPAAYPASSVNSNNNPYAGLGVRMDVAPAIDRIEREPGVKITYRLSGPMTLLIDQASVPYGQEHRIEMEETADFVTSVFPFSRFRQPESAAMVADLQNDQITGLKFQITTPQAGSASLYIKSLEFVTLTGEE